MSNFEFAWTYSKCFWMHFQWYKFQVLIIYHSKFINTFGGSIYYLDQGCSYISYTHRETFHLHSMSLVLLHEGPSFSFFCFNWIEISRCELYKWIFALLKINELKKIGCNVTREMLWPKSSCSKFKFLGVQTNGFFKAKKQYARVDYKWIIAISSKLYIQHLHLSMY